MKTCKHLFERVCSFDNLWQAFHQARKGKRARGEVAAFEYALERNLWQPCWSASAVDGKTGGLRIADHQTVLAVGLKPSARRDKARLRGRERNNYSKTIQGA